MSMRYIIADEEKAVMAGFSRERHVCGNGLMVLTEKEACARYGVEECLEKTGGRLADATEAREAVYAINDGNE